jgi:serine/threonine protein kinase
MHFSGYIAPELYENQPYRFEPDMFSFGVLLFRLLFGEKPFPYTNERRLRVETVRLKYVVNTGSDRWLQISDSAKHLIRRLLISKDTRLTASMALQHDWFQENRIMDDSVLHLKGNNTRLAEGPSGAMALSRAPKLRSPRGSGKFWIDASIRSALERLIEKHGHTGWIINTNAEYNEDGADDEDVGLICVEEIHPPSAVVLPAYIAQLPRYSEYEARMVFRQIMTLVQCFHDLQVSHRNLHVENILIEPREVCRHLKQSYSVLSGNIISKTFFSDIASFPFLFSFLHLQHVDDVKVMLRGIEHAQYIRPDTPLTGHFGRLYSWYAFTYVKHERWCNEYRSIYFHMPIALHVLCFFCVCWLVYKELPKWIPSYFMIKEWIYGV